MIHYRKAMTKDAEVLAVLRSQFLIESKETAETDRSALQEASLAFFKDYLSNENFVAAVAEENGDIIATGGISYFRKPPSSKCPSGIVAYIMNMYTVPEHRGRGVASNVFSFLCEDAKKRGCGQIMLNATEMGRPIYQKYGFIDSKDDMILYIDQEGQWTS